MSTSKQKINIGLFGLGCVGQGLYDLLQQEESPFTIKKVVVKNSKKERSVPRELLSFERSAILSDPEIDIIVEAIDDADEALELCKSSLRLKVPFVSANKKMVANNLSLLAELQKNYATPILYEAAACAEIPVVKFLSEQALNATPDVIRGIYNGTTNYILTQMSIRGISYREALKEAQAKGFAESDPSSDVDGWDSLYKATILSAVSTRIVSPPERGFAWGIKNINLADLQAAEKEDGKIKLLGYSINTSKGPINFVLPTLIQAGDPAYEIDNEWNIVQLDEDIEATSPLKGRGAGAEPTARAVFQNLAEVAAGNEGYTLDLQSLSLDVLEEVNADIYLRCKPETLTQLLPALTLSNLEMDGEEAVFKGQISLGALKRQKNFLYESGASVLLLKTPSWKPKTALVLEEFSIH